MTNQKKLLARLAVLEKECAALKAEIAADRSKQPGPDQSANLLAALVQLEAAASLAAGCAWKSIFWQPLAKAIMTARKEIHKAQQAHVK